MKIRERENEPEYIIFKFFSYELSDAEAPYKSFELLSCT